jgi:hypothetical protein
LERALADLQAEVIAVPPFESKHLLRGHAVHYRCFHPEALRMRVDVMAKMRGVDPFAKLWRRRAAFELPDGTICNLLSLPDLVQAKKTQRNKDWPMIQRLVESHYFQHQVKPDANFVKFWLRELRTPELLIDIAHSHPGLCHRMSRQRPLLVIAVKGRVDQLEAALRDEELAERQNDKVYWLPLRRELEKLRHARVRRD